MAVIAGDASASYGELDAASRRVAAHLLGGEGDLVEARIACRVPPGPDHVAALAGIWRAGGVAVPLALSHPPSEIDFVLRDAQASVVLVTADDAAALAPLARAAGVRLVAVDEALAAAPRPLPVVQADRRALMLYTSGTTGRPKGVVTTHANVAAQVEALVEAWGWTASDRALLVLPLHHVHGLVNVVLSALRTGAVCEMQPGFDAAAVWSRLGSGEVTVFTAVPTIYHRLIAAWDAAPADVRRAWSAGAGRARLMMSGSAALPVSTLARWREITGHTLLERYGMTELGMALANPLEGERRPGTVGVPLPRVEVRVVDEAGRDVAPGVAGELLIRGPGVFLEYWRRPDETRAAFQDGWFRTGDVAVEERGVFRLLGRTSIDILKTGGYKVSALEIEEAVRAHPAVGDCAVVGLDDEEWGQRVVVAVEPAAGVAVEPAALVAWLRSRLAPYKLPREVLVVPALPRNAMGKVVKPDVAALFSR